MGGREVCGGVAFKLGAPARKETNTSLMGMCDHEPYKGQLDHSPTAKLRLQKLHLHTHCVYLCVYTRTHALGVEPGSHIL